MRKEIIVMYEDLGTINAYYCITKGIIQIHICNNLTDDLKLEYFDKCLRSAKERGKMIEVYI